MLHDRITLPTMWGHSAPELHRSAARHFQFVDLLSREAPLDIFVAVPVIVSERSAKMSDSLPS